MYEGQQVRAKHDGKLGMVKEIHEDWDCWWIQMEDGSVYLLRDDQVESSPDNPIPDAIAGDSHGS